MWKNLTIPIMLIIITLLNMPVLAGDIQVEAFVNETNLQLGESITLTVRVQGELNVDAPEVQIKDFNIQYYGPSTQLSIVNGRRSEVVNHLYAVEPLKAGTLTIPAITVRVKGRDYQTKPVILNVNDPSSSDTNVAGNNKMVKDIGNEGEQVFIEVEIPRTKLYLNEEISLTVRLFVRQDVKLKEINYPILKVRNFLVAPFTEPEQLKQQKSGQYYYVFPFKTTIQPLAKGDYKIGPVELNVSVLVSRRSYSSFFDSDYELIPVKLSAQGISVQVLDFPTVGKPASFKGAVGSFSMDINVTPKKVNPGEPITVQMTISGPGSYNTVTAPVLEHVAGFKYYDPQVISSGRQQGPINQKIFEQVIIPTQVNVLPEVTFSYFDPVEEKYQTLKSGPLSIEISGDKTVGQGVTDYRENRQAGQILGQDILYIKANPGQFRPVQKLPLVSTSFLTYNGTILTFLLSGFFWNVWRNRETPVKRRRKEIVTKTAQLLKESEKLLHTGQNVAFYNTVYQAVQNYLKEYFEFTITGISEYESERLLTAGLKPELLEEIRKFYREIDEKRFAGTFGNKADMERVLNKAQEIVANIGKGGVA